MKTRKTYNIDKKVADKVEKNADKEGRSKSDIANRALAAQLKVKI